MSNSNQSQAIKQLKEIQAEIINLNILSYNHLHPLFEEAKQLIEDDLSQIEAVGEQAVKRILGHLNGKLSRLEDYKSMPNRSAEEAQFILKSAHEDMVEELRLFIRQLPKSKPQ